MLQLKTSGVVKSCSILPISPPSSQFIASTYPTHQSSVIALNFANVFQSLGNLFCTDFKYSARPKPQQFILHKHDEEYSEGESGSNNHSSVKSKQKLSKQTENILISRSGLLFSGLPSPGYPKIVCRASRHSSNQRRFQMETISKPLSGGVWVRGILRNHHRREWPVICYGKVRITRQIRI